MILRKIILTHPIPGESLRGRVTPPNSGMKGHERKKEKEK